MRASWKAVTASYDGGREAFQKLSFRNLDAIAGVNSAGHRYVEVTLQHPTSYQISIKASRHDSFTLIPNQECAQWQAEQLAKTMFQWVGQAWPFEDWIPEESEDLKCPSA